MSSPAITTVIKMMDSLPEQAQEQVAEHLREYLEELQDDIRWDRLFQKTQPQLAAAARRARQEIAAGKASPMNYDQL
ncbi:MAG: hypothetical protein HZY76_10570 [Anaerolineae bacterium]|nr:MAG: hypothetical protein HZY76_10570 [Anaerolineae bacterium]